MRRRRCLHAALAALLLAPAPALAAQFSCDEPGVLAAIAAGGGPHTIACAGPTTVVTSAEIGISQTVELDGGGLLTLSGGGAHRIFGASSLPIFITLRNLALRDGSTTGAGGCIASESILTLDHVHVSGCHADGSGGGILASSDLTLTDSSIVGNSSSSAGGGIHVGDGFGFSGFNVFTLTRSVVEENQAGNAGGGIFTQAAFATITESTIRGNRAQSAGGISFHAFSNSILASITRSTISGNRATSPLAGGGIYAFGAVVNVSNSTLALNPPVAIRTDGFPPLPGPTPNYLILDHTTIVAAAGSAPSAIVQQQLEDGYSHVRLRHSLIRGRCNLPGYSDGVNVESPGHSCTAFAPTDLTDVPQSALQLGKLGDHGGATQTVPIHSPSVAIDAGVGCTAATDQRGVARPQGAACDVGAFEQDFTEVVPASPPWASASLALALIALGWRAGRAAYCSKQ